ncbi:MAG TPA: DUF58 domain-containing protein [Candidatus Methylacidiphilales bacterium]|jgi:uncharacterized protein (DUF58 family)|nr:DUF58 domain-containing protein [Candidatus Methylacidiphilales bacterium]
MVFLPRFYFTLVVAILLALGSTLIPNGMAASLLLTLLLTCAVLADAVLIPRDALRVKRNAPPILKQAQPFQVELTLVNQSETAASFQIVDSPPVDFTGSPKMIVVRLPPKREILQTYSLKSYRRGTFSFGAVFYRITGPLGLIQRQGKIDLAQQVQVLPDMTGEGSRDLQLALAGAFQAGRRKTPRRGEGSEFESLREHQRDDDFRHIDWKASAKRGKLISRQYETERDQRLMILLDTGRLMSPRIGSYRKLDYAINASVHLAQIALHKGDLVGYAIFNDELRAFAEPKKGQARMSRFVKDLTSLQAARLESDYAAVFHHVMRRCSRRTLIVCFTDLGDAHSAESLLQAALPLLPRHLPVIVTVSNSEILAVTRKSPENEFEVYRHVAAMEIWNDYQRTLRGLRSRGVATVSVPAQELSTAAINEYLRIKETAWL